MLSPGWRETRDDPSIHVHRTNTTTLQVFERFMELPQGDSIQAEYICKYTYGLACWL
jgi:hypothetical protein